MVQGDMPVATALSELARLVQGTLAGDGTILISGAKPLNEAGPGDITFLEGDRYLKDLQASQAAAVVAGPALPAQARPVIQVADPLTAFLILVRHFQGAQGKTRSGIDPRAAIHYTAQLGDGCSVAPYAAIGEGAVLGQGCQIHSHVTIGRGCKIGNDAILYPGVVLYEGTVLGERVIIHANTVIGGDGFGYRFQDGRHVKVPQLGSVEIADDVEIGACTTIDRGTFQATRVGRGTKIDNLVQVAHNCQLGQHNLIVSQVGIAGSSSTGDYVVIAGQVGIVDHAHIGNGAVIGAKAGVTKDVAPGLRMLGAPATPEREQKRILMSLEKLPEIRRDLKRIKQQLGLDDSESAA
jgi:UDP-3-O-[3-hydroxymyristoyl] glucosamine N-acyltransferase